MKTMVKHHSTEGSYSAFDAAVYYLSFKDRTVSELSDKLRQKDYNEADIEEAVSKLLYYGYLNDEKYACAYIKDNRYRKGAGLMKRELLFKGIDNDIICNAMETFKLDSDEEIDAVRNIYNHRFSKVDISDEKQKRRVLAYFQRKGFAFNTINTVIKNAGE